MRLVTSIEKQWSELLDTNSQLKLQTTIPELLATEELEPNSRNYDKKFKYKAFILNFNY